MNRLVCWLLGHRSELIPVEMVVHVSRDGYSGRETYDAGNTIECRRCHSVLLEPFHMVRVLPGEIIHSFTMRERVSESL